MAGSGMGLGVRVLFSFGNYYLVLGLPFLLLFGLHAFVSQFHAPRSLASALNCFSLCLLLVWVIWPLSGFSVLFEEGSWAGFPGWVCFCDWAWLGFLARLWRAVLL